MKSKKLTATLMVVVLLSTILSATVVRATPGYIYVSLTASTETVLPGETITFEWTTICEPCGEYDHITYFLYVEDPDGWLVDYTEMTWLCSDGPPPLLSFDWQVPSDAETGYYSLEMNAYGIAMGGCSASEAFIVGVGHADLSIYEIGCAPIEVTAGFDPHEEFTVPVTIAYDIDYADEQTFRIKVELWDTSPLDVDHFFEEVITEALEEGEGFLQFDLTAEWMHDGEHGPDWPRQEDTAKLYLSSGNCEIVIWDGQEYELWEWGPWIYLEQLSCVSGNPDPVPSLWSERGQGFLEGIEISNKFYARENEGHEFDYVEFCIDGELFAVDYHDDTIIDGAPWFESISINMGTYDSGSSIVTATAHEGDSVGSRTMPLSIYSTPVWLREFEDDGKITVDYLDPDRDFDKGWKITIPETEIAGIAIPETAPENWYEIPDSVPIVNGSWGVSFVLELGSGELDNSGWDDPAGVTPSGALTLMIADHAITFEAAGPATWVDDGWEDGIPRCTMKDGRLGPVTYEYSNRFKLWSWGGTVEVLGAPLGLEVGVRLIYGIGVALYIVEDDEAAGVYLMKYDGLDWSEAEISPTLGLEAYIEGGIPHFLEGGASAEGYITMTVHVPPPFFEDEFLEVNITFKAYIKLVEWTVWQDSWEAWSVSLPSTQEVVEQDFPVQWMPRYWDVPGYAHYLWSAGASEGIYLDNAFPHSAPNVASSGGTTMMVWLQDDMAKTYPRSIEVYSAALDLDTLVWGEPEPITDDEFHQGGHPVIEFDKDGDAIAAWSTSTEPDITTETAIDSTLLETQEIEYAVWDHVSESWSQPQLLTDNSIADELPMLARDESGQLMLLWLSRDDPMDFETTIHSSTWDGTDWSDPETVVQNVLLQTAPALANHSGEAIAVWPQHADGNITTKDDIELYCSSFDGTTWSSPTQLTTNSVEERSPSLIFDSAGNPLLSWVEARLEENDTLKVAELVSLDGGLTFSLGEPSVVAERPGMGDPCMLVNSANQRVAVWSDGFYRTPLHSVYDTVTGAWSEPQPLIGADVLAETPYNHFSSCTMTDTDELVLVGIAEAMEGGVIEEYDWSKSALYSSTNEILPTGPVPPSVPSKPSPANHATAVSITTDLSWSGGDPDDGDMVTYDVYCGTSATPPLRETIGPYPATQSSVSYDPGTLSDNTKYYWKIVARDNHGVTREGPVWDFTTGLPGSMVTWDLRWGLDADPASVNIWTYPGDAVAVNLADVESSMPSGLLIWHYGGPTEGWRFYKKGWGAVNTLELLVPGSGYIGIVPTAGVLEIPQG